MTGLLAATLNDASAHITKDTLASLLRRNDDSPPIDQANVGLDRRTVSYIHTILHRALKDAVRWDRLVRNPADATDPPRSAEKTAAVRAWDAATLRSFLDRSRKDLDRMRPIWVVLATTGMRRGEVLGLRWADVDLDSGHLRVMQTVIQTQNVVSIGVPKTAQGRRSVSLAIQRSSKNASVTRPSTSPWVSTAMSRHDSMTRRPTGSLR